jgi:hypothetical protein
MVFLRGPERGIDFGMFVWFQWLEIPPEQLILQVEPLLAHTTPMWLGVFS